jgi:hypothetical protein
MSRYSSTLHFKYDFGDHFASESKSLLNRLGVSQRDCTERAEHQEEELRADYDEPGWRRPARNVTDAVEENLRLNGPDVWAKLFKLSIFEL